MGPRVSIVVPVYNAEPFLARSTRSVTSQSYRNIEIILIDDGSTDSSRAMCEEYAAADDRIQVVSQQNSGPAAARNTGVANATGELIFFLDADDYIRDDTIEILMEVYQRHQADLVMSNFCKLVDEREAVEQSVTFCPDDSPFTGQERVLSPEDNANFVRHFLQHPSNHMISYCWARLYKKSIIDEHGIRADEEMRLFEDFIFNLEYLRHARRVVFVNESLYTYVMHDTHVSASMAIMDTSSLLHDMGVFRSRAGEFLGQDGGVNDAVIQEEIGHALVHYVIIFMIRSCRQVTRDNRQRVFREVHQMVHAPFFQDCLRHYTPTGDNSRLVPLLMRLRATRLLMYFCRRRSHKRYGRPGKP